ncbi:NADH-quinone oxidoreductase subunit B family protein [Consotaella salsifontis]|uniref:[NiFe]-hydrogenase III apoprotein, small subunit n=1 Tax=Consotaella salsifontis TaxID=1365950 RepID=A0A1T4RNE4_9HYPH|nr:NADH-quinone oxidoreductase subunit B family protein [Consotaella salsifontis]SKA17453.1 [NiFe]-hydrogenase III apoprotein, small subunit [Consotaella salsifontis]
MNAPVNAQTLLTSPGAVSIPAQIAAMKATLLKDIQRSAYVYRVDCGGCNGCEIEIFASITPVFDAERFGIKVVPSPRHADILLYTGAMTRAMRMPALRAYEAAPDPKIVVSYGACGCTGGIFHDLYCTWGGTDQLVPVDVYIPGCPPTPAATIYGFAVALGLLGQKLKAETHIEAPGEAAPLAHPDIPYVLRVAIEREARRMAGYRQGRDIAEEFFAVIEQQSDTPFPMRMAQLRATEPDPRRVEIFSRLESVVAEALQA